jgi:hypothetical protein
LKYAYGVLGLSVEELAGLTPCVFELKCEGYKMQSDHTENMFRKVAFFSMAPHLDSKNNVTPQSVWPMDIDEGNKGRVFFSKRVQKQTLDNYAKIKQRRLEKQSALTN